MEHRKNTENIHETIWIQIIIIFDGAGWWSGVMATCIRNGPSSSPGPVIGHRYRLPCFVLSLEANGGMLLEYIASAVEAAPTSQSAFELS